MAKKTNKKPGHTHKSEAAMMMKKKSKSLNSSKFGKIILLLMVLSFIVPGILVIIGYIVNN